MSVILRFAPSPTGHLHLGGARTALFNWLYARRVASQSGEEASVLLRFEDTDPHRSREKYADSIREALEWLGLRWSGEIVRQSQRLSLYQSYLEQLESQGLVYRCYCSPGQLEKEREMARAAGRRYRYPGTCRGRGIVEEGLPYVLRLAVPELEVAPIFDKVVGRIAVSGADIDDFVLTRSDGSPLYNLCCVVDDALMGVTHVIRGSDHVENTRKQALLYDALGFERPEFAHLPLVAGLSKRQGATSVLEFRERGLLPEAVINYIARLGWSHGDQEVFDVEELGRAFRLADVGHSTARVNEDKLLWLNEKHLHRADTERLGRLLGKWLPELDERGRKRVEPAIEIYKRRCRDLVELSQSILPCLIEDSRLELELDEHQTVLTQSMQSYLVELTNLVGRLESYERETLKAAMWEQLSARGLGFRQVAPACRLALIGNSAGPRLLDLMMVLGRESVMNRFRRAAGL